VIRHRAGPGDERAQVTESRYMSDLNFFMVWEYESDLLPNMGLDSVDAHTIGRSCFFEDHVVRPVEAMAHEIGHLLGRPDQYDHSRSYNLMYAWPTQRGARLTKEDSNAMNPAFPWETA
jgi:hypothetical protein